MNNEELKEKIVDILVNCKSQECAVEYCATCEGNPYIEHCREKEQADALIAAGLRFGENLTATFDHMALEREHELERRLAEAEHRAEIAERALRNAAPRLNCRGGLGKGFCKVDKCDYYHCNNDDGCVKAHLDQAEKELAEGRKDVE